MSKNRKVSEVDVYNLSVETTSAITPPPPIMQFRRRIPSGSIAQII